jgi:drug/metabolite transporter (DMT)-like permease
MLAAALALLTSFCYGTSNYIGPRLSRDLPTYAVLMTGQVVAFCVSAAVVAAGVAGAVPDASVWAAAAAAGLGNACGLIAFYRAAAIGPVSIATTIGSLGVTLPVLAGVASGEPLGAVKAAGVVLAVAGVALAARRPGGATSHPPAALGWGLASAIGFGGFLTFMAPASHGGVFWAVALSRAMVLGVLGLAAWKLGEAVRAPARRLGAVTLPGLLLFAGTLAYSAATRAGDLSVVSVLGTLATLVTVGLAYLVGGERLTRAQGAGVLIAVAGVVLVSLRA